MYTLRPYDPTVNGGSNRFDCPVCARGMYYSFPSPVDDKELDGLLWRIQECRNKKCREQPQFDVVTGEQVMFPMKDTLGAVRAYFIALGALKPKS